MGAIDHPDGMRTCSGCGKTKPLTEYHLDSRAPSGRRTQCAECRSARMKAWYAANRERQMMRARERFARDIEKIRANDLKRYRRHHAQRVALATEAYHARRVALRSGVWVRGITHTALRKRDGDRCCYCGVQMTFTATPGMRYNPTRATIEHLLPISAGGAHDWDNVALACHQCNLRRNKMPMDQWLERLKVIRSETNAPA